MTKLKLLNLLADLYSIALPVGAIFGGLWWLFSDDFAQGSFAAIVMFTFISFLAYLDNRGD